MLQLFPRITVSGIPTGTKYLTVELKDLDVPSWDHGGGKVVYKGSSIIPAGSLKNGYHGHCPPSGPTGINLPFMPLTKKVVLLVLGERRKNSLDSPLGGDTILKMENTYKGGNKMTEEKKKAAKIDYKKDFKYLFSPSAKEPEIVEVPDFKYIMIDGKGYPGTSKDFQDKIQVLYGLSYTIKFMLKLDKIDPLDYTVPPLSGLYYADDMKVFVEEGRREEWEWTVMILQPDRVTEAIFEKAKEQLVRKKNLPFIDKAYLQIYKEGLSAQIMHLGPYDQEAPTIEKLHTFFQSKGYTFNGKHHEIYLSDPRRGKPEKIKTVIRQPIKKIS